MTNYRGTHASFLKDAWTLIENAGAIPELAEIIAEYGYTKARLDEGRKLWAEADELSKKQSLEQGEHREANQEFGRAWDRANATYIKTLKVARVAFSDQAKAITALKLYGPRKQTLAGWLERAGTFYANLGSDPSLQLGLERFGYSAKKLEAESALVEGLKIKAQASALGSGAAQSATAARDRKFKELDAWVSDFRTICRVAFYENPQELERLGVLVLNSHRRTTKTEAAASTS